MQLSDWSDRQLKFLIELVRDCAIPNEVERRNRLRRRVRAMVEERQVREQDEETEDYDDSGGETQA